MSGLLVNSVFGPDASVFALVFLGKKETKNDRAHEAMSVFLLSPTFFFFNFFETGF